MIKARLLGAVALALVPAVAFAQAGGAGGGTGAGGTGGTGSGAMGGAGTGTGASRGAPGTGTNADPGAGSLGNNGVGTGAPGTYNPDTGSGMNSGPGTARERRTAASGPIRARPETTRRKTRVAPPGSRADGVQSATTPGAGRTAIVRGLFAGRNITTLPARHRARPSPPSQVQR